MACLDAFLTTFCVSAIGFCFVFTMRLTYNNLQVSHVAQLVKNLPAVQETWVRSLGWEDPLEKEMATQPSILAWTATVHAVTKDYLLYEFIFKKCAGVGCHFLL